MAQTIVISSIGSASRDFSTVTLWEASLPASFITGDGRMEFGQMFADSIFSETPSLFSGITFDQVNYAVLENAPGESPEWRPSGGGISVVGSVSIKGIIFDGRDGSGDIVTWTVAPRLMHNCIFRNGTASGIKSGNQAFVHCLFHDNVTHGLTTLSGQGPPLVNCGFARNGSDGAVNTGSGIVRPRGCWSLGNGGASFTKINNSIDVAHCFVDDTVFTDESITQFNLNESQVVAALGFADFDGSNFQLKTDSILRKVGLPLAWGTTQGIAGMGSILPSDLLNRFIALRVGDSFDVGPYQGAAPDLATGGRLLVTGML